MQIEWLDGRLLENTLKILKFNDASSEFMIHFGEKKLIFSSQHPNNEGLIILPINQDAINYFLNDRLEYRQIRRK